MPNPIRRKQDEDEMSLPEVKRRVVEDNGAVAAAVAEPLQSLSVMNISSPVGQNEGSLVTVIPPEILAHILSFLSGRELGRIQAVCRRWHELICKMPVLVKKWILGQAKMVMGQKDFLRSPTKHLLNIVKIESQFDSKAARETLDRALSTHDFTAPPDEPEDSDSESSVTDEPPDTDISLCDLVTTVIKLDLAFALKMARIMTHPLLKAQTLIQIAQASDSQDFVRSTLLEARSAVTSYARLTQERMLTLIQLARAEARLDKIKSLETFKECLALTRSQLAEELSNQHQLIPMIEASYEIDRGFAEECLHEAKTTAQLLIRGSPDHLSALFGLLRGQIILKRELPDLSEILEMIRSIENLKTRLDSMIELATIVGPKSSSVAQNLLNEAKELAKSFDKLPIDLAFHFSLAKAAEKLFPQMAVAIYNEIYQKILSAKKSVSESYDNEETFYDTSLFELVKRCAHLDMTLAKEAFIGIDAPHYHNLALLQLAQAEKKVDRMQARKTALSIPTPFLQATALIEISSE